MAAGRALLGERSPTDDVNEPVEVDHRVFSFADQEVRAWLEYPLTAIFEEADVILTRFHLGVGDEYFAGGSYDAAGLLTEEELHLEFLGVLELFGDAQRVKNVHQVIEDELLGVWPAVMQHRVLALLAEVVLRQYLRLVFELLFQHHFGYLGSCDLNVGLGRLADV